MLVSFFFSFLFIFFHSCTGHFDVKKSFIYQLMHNRFALKEY